jgi:predicted N-acetyltransferase YhbS
MACASADADVRARVKIVTAQADHAAGLRELVALAYAQEGESWSGKPHSPADADVTLAEVEAMIAASRSRLLAVLEGETVVGCVLVTRLPGGRSALGLLGVDHGRRRRGLGARLIAAAERAAIDSFGANGIELCVLAERKSLTAYYQRHGFSRTGEERKVRHWRADMAFVVMAKPFN